MADLLAAASHSDGDGYGVGIATILRKGNVPYPRALEMLRSLVRAGLVFEVSHEEKTRYPVTENGFRYLATYRDLEGFARSFDLRL